jgi:hypothetical protein
VDPVDPGNLACLVDLGNLVSLADLAEPLSLVPLLDSIAGRVLSPCKLWNRRGRLIFHIDCKRISLEGWDGRSIVLVREL